MTDKIWLSQNEARYWGYYCRVYSLRRGIRYHAQLSDSASRSRNIKVIDIRLKVEFGSPTLTLRRGTILKKIYGQSVYFFKLNLKFQTFDDKNNNFLYL